MRCSIMETSLKGKICAVTGANTGLGFKASEVRCHLRIAAAADGPPLRCVNYAIYLHLVSTYPSHKALGRLFSAQACHCAP
jgi:hypothetical protein